MSQINVKKIQSFPDMLFEVEVVSDTTTFHNVHLSNDYYRKLTEGKIGAEELIKLSFEFLLEREPNTMILREFDLKVIGRYFPDFEEKISKVAVELH